MKRQDPSAQPWNTLDRPVRIADSDTVMGTVSNRILRFTRVTPGSSSRVDVTDTRKLKGKIALVSGASHGIGHAIALALGRQGASVVVNYCSSHVEAEAACMIIRAAGSSAYPIPCDVADADACNRMVEETLDEFGQIDILVNNAGIRADAPFHLMHRQQWDTVMRTNLDGVYNLTRAVINPMRQRGYGRIIFITESSLRLAADAHANLAASKAALTGLARGLAGENAHLGITVNCVCPGVIDTRRIQRFTAAERETILARIPTGRLGQPDDVAEAVAFLASDIAGYITGQELHIDGGLSLH